MTNHSIINQHQYLSLLLKSIIAGLLTAGIVYAWTNPTANPPSGGGALYYYNGNVGIGTTGPTRRLTVKSSSTSTAPVDIWASDGSSLSYFWETSGGDGEFAVENAAGSEKVYLSSNGNSYLNGGNVGIGTTTPSSKLHVLGDDVVLKIQSVTPAVETTIFSGSSGGVNRSTIFTTGSMLSLGAGGSTRMSILSGGNVGIAMTDPSVALDVTGDIEYTGTITDVSDIRLKENIEPIDGALDKLLTLNGVSFNMIGDDRRNLGFTAQEVQKVFPEAVSVVDPENGYLGLDYTQMAPPLLEGIKELYGKVQGIGTNEKGDVIIKNGNVGIGTTGPGAKLEVAGQVKITGGTPGAGEVLTSDAVGLATWEPVAVAGVPSGFVGFFNLGVCPSGWTALVAAQGRYLVGLPSAGTLAGTAGTALTNLENRAVGQHNHGITDPGHAHSIPASGSTASENAGGHTGSGSTGSAGTGLTINNTGAVVGTNAPYLQLLVCQKD